MKEVFLILNVWAAVLGWCVMAGALAALIHDTSQIRLRDDVKNFVVLGFGLLWFERKKEAKLYLNARKCGYRLWVVRKYVFGPVYPRWFVLTVQKLTGMNPL